jgi:hypothetical protein
MSDLDNALQDLGSNISGFISTDVVDIETGMSMGGYSADPDFDGSVASAAFAEVVQAYKRAFELLDMNPNSIQDLLGTADEVLVLQRLLGDGSYYHGLAMTKDGNLALARKTMETYESDILDAVNVDVS